MEWFRRWRELASRGRVLVALLALNVLLIWGFGVRARLYAPPDALAAQLAFWPSVFGAIVVDLWGPKKAHDFLVSLLTLDSVFPLAYASFLGGFYTWLCRALEAPPRPRLQAAPWIACLLDLVENALQVWLVGCALGGGAGARSFATGVLVMSSCAALKWTLVVTSVLGSVAVLLRSEVGWAVWTCRFALLSVLLGSPLSSTSQGLDLLRAIADDALSTPQALGAYLALVLWASSVWYWSRVLLRIRWRSGEPGELGEQAPGGRWIALWLPRVLGVATLLLAALAFMKASSGAPAELHSRLVRHAATCFVLALGFLYFVTRRRQWLGLPAEPQRVEEWSHLPAVTRDIAALAMVLSVVLLCSFVVAPLPLGRRLGAPAIVFLAAANAVFFGSGLVVLSRWVRAPLVAFALLAAACFSFWNDNHAVRLVTSTGAPPPRPELIRAFETWAGPRLEAWRIALKTGRMPVFLVTAEGGGVRAAYWTAVVLARLQDRHPEFAPHTFAISGVSGGSVGAATYVALLKDQPSTPACGDYAKRSGHEGDARGLGAAETCAQEVLRQDFLAPVLAKLVSPDFLQWFLPIPVPVFDRGRALEDSWAAAYEEVTARKTLDQPFLGVSCDVGPDGALSRELARPALMLNGTHVHTGQRLLRAPFSWPREFPDDPAQDQLPQVTDLTDLLQADVRLSTAAHDSARFAYVSPAGRLLSARGRDFGHVVDGGYFENSGADTLQHVLRVLQTSRMANDVEFVFVYLCNNPDRCFGATVGADPMQAQNRAPDLSEVSSPLRALLGARDARGGLAIARAKQALGRQFLEFGVCPVADGPTIPLGWHLSEIMRKRLSAQARADGVPGNAASEACLERALDGVAGTAATCDPPFTPAEGCP